MSQKKWTQKIHPPPRILLVLPCFNEEEVLPVSEGTLEKLFREMIASGQIAPQSRICFVNDGSRDRTWEIVRGLCFRAGTLFRGIDLSRNFGHQAALLAGLFSFADEFDAFITIDADLQDDERAIVPMVESFRRGNDIVYGVRARRDTDSFFKKQTALAFYRLRDWLSGGETICNHADFRLMSRRAVRELSRFRETNLYLRGLIPMLGFPSDRVFYDRKARELGESKYPLGKMLKLAWNGIVNFSDAPLKLLTAMGLAGGAVCALFLVYVVAQWVLGNVVPGWATIVFAIVAVGSVQLVSLGILGSYIGKIFLETKRRPSFIVKETLPRGNAASADSTSQK